MSKGARAFLGIIALLLGALMAAVAPDDDKRVFFYGFTVFCTLMAAVCFTQGRARQFFGSVFGSSVFLIGVWYLATQLQSGPLYSGARSQPSVVNAVLFLVIFGIPGIVYAWRARFGVTRIAP
jgi:hypothetical protein